MNTKIDFVTVKDMNSVPEGYFLVNGVYLSGELEQSQEFDFCACSENIIFHEEGIYDVTFNKEEGFILYLWKADLGAEIEVNRGLLCDVEDLTGCQAARTSFNKKSEA